MATYTTLSEVKRILRSSSEDIVRFSDSLASVSTYKEDSRKKNLDLQVDDTKIVPASSFQGDLILSILFEDATTYKVFKKSQGKNSEVLLNSGISISSDYTTPDGQITIKSGTFSGTIEKDDKVDLRFDAHISDDNADLYIQDVETEIDLMVTTNHIKQSVAGSIYSSGSVPPEVKVAASYLSAYYIYTDVFVNIYKQDGGQSNYAERWKHRGEKFMMKYIEREAYQPATAVAFPRYIDKVGVDSEAFADAEGPGMKGLEEDYDDWNHDSKTEHIFDAQSDEHWDS